MSLCCFQDFCFRRRKVWGNSDTKRIASVAVFFFFLSMQMPNKIRKSRDKCTNARQDLRIGLKDDGVSNDRKAGEICSFFVFCLESRICIGLNSSITNRLIELEGIKTLFSQRFSHFFLKTGFADFHKSMCAMSICARPLISNRDHILKWTMAEGPGILALGLESFL